MDYMKHIVEALSILQQRDLIEKQPFKARAYSTIIKQLKQLNKPIHVYEDLQGIAGIGEKIEQKIKEILATGHLQSAERVKEEYHTESLKAFQQIYGVGPAKAKELVEQGFKTIADLRANPQTLNDKQKIGLMYYEDLLERIPRAEMDQHKEILYEHLPADMVFESEIVGSYRRGAQTSGDIDILLKATQTSMTQTTQPKQTKQTKQLQDFVTVLHTEGYILEILAIGAHKCMAICQLPGQKARRLDILIVSDTEYAYSLLYFTGSDLFNIAFRQHCISKGYTLNEHTLLSATVIIPSMASEKDIFTFVGLRYVTPCERVDARQIVPLRVRPQVAR